MIVNRPMMWTTGLYPLRAGKTNDDPSHEENEGIKDTLQ
jgi:hypothetical protein